MLSKEIGICNTFYLLYWHRSLRDNYSHKYLDRGSSYPRMTCMLQKSFDTRDKGQYKEDIPCCCLVRWLHYMYPLGNFINKHFQTICIDFCNWCSYLHTKYIRDTFSHMVCRYCYMLGSLKDMLYNIGCYIKYMMYLRTRNSNLKNCIFYNVMDNSHISYCIGMFLLDMMKCRIESQQPGYQTCRNSTFGSRSLYNNLRILQSITYIKKSQCHNSVRQGKLLYMIYLFEVHIKAFYRLYS